MKQSTQRTTIALVAVLLGATAAQADVTPEEVWEGMTSYYTSLGQRVTTGSEDRQGDTLVITNAVFSSSVPEGTFSATVDELRLKDLGDGRVELTMSETIPLHTTARPEDGEAVEMEIDMTQSGLAMIVSGSTDDTGYDFTAPELAVEIVRMTADGKEVPVTTKVKLEGNSGSYRMVSDGARKMTSSVRSDKVDFDIAAKDPDTGADIAASGSFVGLSGTSDALIPENVTMDALSEAVGLGLTMKGEFSYVSGGYVMDFDDAGEKVHLESTGGGGRLHFAMSEDGMSYGGSGGPAQMSMQMSAFPMPIDFSIAQSAFDLTMPVMARDETQPFGLLLKLVDLEVSDGIWGLFDPAGTLPRDPATLIVDLTGDATMKVNLLDPKSATAEPGTPPGTLDALTINAVEVSAVGAELTGSGAMTFDNSADTPKPVGTVDLKLEGGNALIDKLVAMNLIPADQAMGARMMMGLFAVPSGEDTLTSKIEFKEDGHVFANGQQIQ